MTLPLPPMKHTLLITLSGSLAASAALEWAVALPGATPAEADWQPCLRRPDGRWRLASATDGTGSSPRHHLEPGLFANLALRYRMTAAGPWSAVASERKEIVIAALTPEQQSVPPAPAGADWSALAPFTAVTDTGSLETAAFALSGAASGAVAVAWTEAAVPAEADWRPCIALGEDHWRLDGPLAHDPTAIAIRLRLHPEGEWSPASAERRSLDVAGLPPIASPPLLLAVPVLLAGSATIGQAVAVDPGLWGGWPLPAVGLQWCRGGVPIPGATLAVYTPVAADDRTLLSCRVSAGNDSGSHVVETAALSVTHAAPVALQAELPDEILDQGTGPEVVPTAQAFAGEALVFGVTGPGASIDPATGLVTLSTDVAVDGAEIVVTATNSGGSATTRFLLTVEAEEALPPPPGLTAAQVTVGPAFWRPAGQTLWRTSRLKVTGVPTSAALSEFEWTLSTGAFDDTTCEPVIRHADGSFEMVMRDPAKRYTDPTLTNFDAAGKRVDYAVHRATDGTASRVKLRYRVRASETAPWTAWSTTAEAVTLPQVAVTAEEAEARPLIMRLPEEFAAAAPAAQKALWSTAVVGGEGLQWMHGHSRGVSDPGRVICGQDMGALRCSRDGARTWYSPTQEGLRVFGLNSVFIDPVDPDFVLITGCYRWAPLDRSQDGLWLSTDFCETFEQVLNLPGVEDANTTRWAKQNFARWPLTSGATGTAKYRYIGMIDPDETIESIVLYASTGGRSWTSKGTVPVSAVGRVATLVQHPTVENTLYICSENGIFETTAWNAAAPVFSAKWTSTFGTASGVTRLWIDPQNPKVMIASAGGTSNNNAAKQGVFYTTDGGASWTRELSSIPCCNLAVGARRSDGSRTVHVHSRGKKTGSVSQPRARRWTGSGFSGSWYAPTTVTLSAAGIPSNESSYRNLSGYSGVSTYGGFCESLPHPTNPEECVLYGYHHYWRTDNAGVAYVDSNSYHAGLNLQGAIKFSPQAADWGEIHASAADVGYVHFFNQARVAESYNISSEQFSALGVSTRSAISLAIIPEASTVPAAKRGRVIMALGTNNQRALFCKAAGATSWTDFNGKDTAQGGGLARRGRMEVDWSNPARVYCGNNVSTDHGDSWSALGKEFLDISRQDSAVLFGFDSTKIYRSTNRGTSWATLWAINTTFTQQCPEAWLDPHDDKRLYTIELVNGVKDLCLLKIGTSVGKTSIGLYDQIAPAYPKKLFRPLMLVVDPRDPKIVYVGLQIIGASWLFRGQWNADFTKITWTDITRNLPRINVLPAIGVSPWTGDVVVGTVNGAFIVPPPAGYRATYGITGSLHDAMPLPVDNGWKSLL